MNVLLNDSVNAEKLSEARMATQKKSLSSKMMIFERKLLWKAWLS